MCATIIVSKKPLVTRLGVEDFVLGDEAPYMILVTLLQLMHPETGCAGRESWMVIHGHFILEPTDYLV